jgi:ATP phosphoribosyltransferase
VSKEKIIIALPKGRILESLLAEAKNLELTFEDDFFNENSRKLSFSTSIKNLSVIKVRSFDVPTIVSKGGADIGISGSDVLEEFSFSNLYTPFDLKIGKCKLALASSKNAKPLNELGSHLLVASKYPNLTRRYFSAKGLQAEIIKLNGSIEIAPKIGLCDYIVDLVSTGKTLKENNMVVRDVILEVSSKVILNKISLKTKDLSSILQELQKLS